MEDEILDHLCSFLEDQLLLMDQQDSILNDGLTESERGLLFENTLMKAKTAQVVLSSERTESFRQVEFCIQSLKRVLLSIREEIEGPENKSENVNGQQAPKLMEMYFLPWFERIQAKIASIEASIQRFAQEQAQVQKLIAKAQSINPQSKAVTALLQSIQSELETNLLLEARLAAEEYLQAELQDEPNMLWAKHRADQQATTAAGQTFGSRLLSLQHGLSDRVEACFKDVALAVRDTVGTAHAEPRGHSQTCRGRRVYPRVAPAAQFGH